MKRFVFAVAAGVLSAAAPVDARIRDEPVRCCAAGTKGRIERPRQIDCSRMAPDSKVCAALAGQVGRV